MSIVSVSYPTIEDLLIKERNRTRIVVRIEARGECANHYPVSVEARPGEVPDFVRRRLHFLRTR